VDDVSLKNTSIDQTRVWLSDMLNPDAFMARFERLRSITNCRGADRSTLPAFMDLFGCTSGLRDYAMRRVVIPGTIGQLIDQRNIQLKRLTKEQEDLAFSPRLLQGRKVIRGVTGSGKTIVLANAVAEAFLTILSIRGDQVGSGQPIRDLKILVLCFNRALAPLLSDLITECFNSRKPCKAWSIPKTALKVVNIDRYMYHLRLEQLKQVKMAETNDLRYKPGNGLIQCHVTELLKNNFPGRRSYDHIFIDEGQDIDFDWYPLIRELLKSANSGGSITVFYDEAQNIYGMKRPGIGDAPTWRELLGEVPNPTGLRTIMRVCHRNTNEILSFSFNVLLGAFSTKDPQMAAFAELASYEKEKIPEDPSIDHRNSGKFCVEKLGERHYQINFAIRKGQPPLVKILNKMEQLEYLKNDVRTLTDENEYNVDPKDILIMCPTTLGVEMVKTILTEAQVKWHSPNKTKVDQEALQIEFRNAGIIINPAIDHYSNRIGDPRDALLFQKTKVSVSTIKSAKGYTAHICYLVFVEDLAKLAEQSEDHMKQARAEFHVGATRATLGLTVLGDSCFLMEEAVKSSEDLH